MSDPQDRDLGGGRVQHPVLPDVLPIFPLVGVLLLPRARLPLNIFEPRYLATVSYTHLTLPTILRV